MNESLLKDLCCPESRQSMRPAAAGLVADLNEQIKVGKLKTKGQSVQDAFDEGLVREDGKSLYPVRGGIPVLLVAEAISVVGDSG